MTMTSTMRVGARALLLGLVLVTMSPVGASAWELTAFDGKATALDGSAQTQAGSHADVTTSFALSSTIVRGLGLPDESVRDVDVELPQGLVGDPTAAPTCTDAELVGGPDGIVPACPIDSQVGHAYVRMGFLPAAFPLEVGVYNMRPTDGVPARFAFNVVGVLVYLDAHLVEQPGGYHLVARIRNISQGVPLLGTELTLWGVPSDPAHDPHRYNPATISFGVGSNLPRRPFMTLPTDCGAGPLTTTIRARSWQSPELWKSASFVSHDDMRPANPTGVTGCERLRFDPSIALAPTNAISDAASGLRVRLTFPQGSSPDGLASAHLKDAAVTLPEGFTINPSSAGGLAGCTDEQLGLGAEAPPRCPEQSKVGTIEGQTPLLAEHLAGGIYVRTQGSSDPGSGEMFRIALVLENAARGISVRLPGQLRVDARSGRIEALFRNNPQLPVSQLDLTFKSGGRAPLATPRGCGSQAATARLTSWAGQTVELTDRFTIPCSPDRGFTPSFAAGTSNPVAGAFTPLDVRVGRQDGAPELGAITIETPPGLTARIASLPSLCGAAEAALGTCPEGARIGSVTTLAGVGDPFSLPGRVYLTGPYAGAPFGLSIVVPAVAGPFDLGVVVVRAAVFVDRTDASLRIVSDALPTILKGVPIRLRGVDVAVDRTRFAINPTNCRRQRIEARISAVTGVTAQAASDFTTTGCAALPFTPRLTIGAGASGKTSKGRRIPLDVKLTMPQAQANNRSVQVTLPKTINARLDVVNKRRACTLEQFRAERCPMSVGSATAVTPLLRDPLRGAAYFVYTPARRLPDLVVRLKGQVDVDLVGKVTITSDLKLRTTFDTVPDVPISSFRLRLSSGPSNGPVGAVSNLCAAATRKASVAETVYVAQNGAVVRRAQAIKVAGCKGKRPAR